MSDIGSGSPPGARPVGQGPRRVTSSFRTVEEKKHDHQNQKDKDHKGRNDKDGVDHGFSVEVDRKLSHLKVGHVISGAIVAIDSDHRIAIQNADGLFAIEGDLGAAGIIPLVGMAAGITIDALQPAMRGTLTKFGERPLLRPLPVLITILELYHSSNQKAPTPGAGHGPAQNYSQQAPAAHPNHPEKSEYGAPAHADRAHSAPPISTDDQTALFSHGVNPQHPAPTPTPKHMAEKPSPAHSPKMVLSPQDMASLITANEISAHEIKPASTPAHPHQNSMAADTHDHWATVNRLLRQYRTAFPDTADDVEKNIRGTSGNIPDGLSLFLGGLIFASPDQWVGPLLAENMDESPAMEELRRDFQELRATILAARDDSWRLFLVPHPEEALDKKLEIIGRQKQVINGQQAITVHTVASRQHYKTLGPVQIDSVIAPNMIDICFHLSEEAPNAEQESIRRLVSLYFRRAGLEGKLRFEPLSASKIAYGAITDALRHGHPPPA